MRREKIIIPLIVALTIGILLFSCGKKEEPQKIKAAHILVMYKGAARAPQEITLSKEQAYKKAKNLLERIKAGEDFSELARKHSDCPSSAQGGELGEFGKGDMVKPFEEAAFNLKKGKISEIVETPFGFHIIKRIG